MCIKISKARMSRKSEELGARYLRYRKELKNRSMAKEKERKEERVRRREEGWESAYTDNIGEMMKQIRHCEAV